MRQFIEIGKIVNTHGVKGMLKVEPWCDSPSVLAKMKKIYFSPLTKGGEYREVKVTRGSVQKDRVLLCLDGVETVDDALRLKNTVIFAHRDDIPIADGAHLIVDLIGLSVIDVSTKTVYGTLSDVIQGGSGDIYEINTEKGKVLIPAVKEFVKKIDLNSGIYIAPIKGMFDED